MITQQIGAICLNVAFALYLVVYLPQIIHNQKSQDLVNLSLKMHFLFYIAYLLDLFYGYSCDLPWQYKTVSIVGLTVLSIQHLQITHYFSKLQKRLSVYLNMLFLFGVGLSIVYFFSINQGIYSESTTLLIGYISRVCFLLYTLPQIIKNKKLKSASAISIQFVYLNLTLAILDLVAAWCLNWGWPNKLGSPIMVALMIVMLLQMKKYSLREYAILPNTN